MSFKESSIKADTTLNESKMDYMVGFEECKFKDCIQPGVYHCYWKGVVCIKDGGCDGMFCDQHQASTSPAQVGDIQIRVCAKCAMDFREF